MTQTVEGDFNPSFHFLGLIQKAQADGVVRRCAVPGCPEVFLVPAENAFYTATATLEALAPLCLAEPFDLTVENLPDWRPDDADQTVQIGRMWLRKRPAAMQTGLNGRPLSELIWYASFCASRGRLLKGCRSDSPVRLRRWPDFSVLPHHDSFPVLAAYMTEHTADLATVATATGVAMAEVFDFYNACAMQGLIERGNVFESGEYLFGLIRRAQSDRRLRRCTLPGQLPLFIDPQAGKFHTHADQATLAEYATAMITDLEVDIVDDLGEAPEEEELVQVGRMWVRRKKASAAPKMPARALSELLFLAALGASRGRLEAGSQPDEPVRLLRWPDAACMGQDRRFFPLAAFMTANAASLPIIAQRTGVPLARVIDFHNACAALGLIEHPGREALTARRVEEGEREALRKISKALDGLLKAGGQHVEHAV